jgi:hypothetical protein
MLSSFILNVAKLAVSSIKLQAYRPLFIVMMFRNDITPEEA